MGPDQIAPIILFAVLVAGGLYFILRPLGSAQSRERARAEGRRVRLLERKAALVQLLRDIEFDKRTGKLSEDDYVAAKEEAEAQALEVMLEIESLEGPWTTDRVESEIASMRLRLESRGRNV
ncbi:MAG: hypothetical protein KDA27_00180 [Candidatus Eisenbacteria bacterium]|uniref:C-type cytochrome biogenesis protein CcmI n=1 Tax=Eiseniibacteriota bacterium TaxID=2212470 RepID=A0A956NA73_UNCEI|nr:hypothetical protein [Candidatus Eisenbacteria bacterium]MCB9463036.1 hypothetical protein [Candidatus Eisenbacteria bacterium]